MDAPGPEPVIRFRNYTPRDATLGESAQMTTGDLPSAKAEAALRDGLSRATAAPVRAQLRALACFDCALTASSLLTTSRTPLPKTHTLKAPDAPVVIVPKKPNWDLKRDLAPKAARLERMTQIAIHDILRKKIAAGAGTGAITNAGAGAAVRAGAGADAGAYATDSLDAVYTGAIPAAVIAARVSAENDD